MALRKEFKISCLLTRYSNYIHTMIHCNIVVYLNRKLSMKKMIENLQPPEVIQDFLDVNEEWAQTYRRKLYAICVKPNGVLV
ncbi:hypothetical protein G52EAM_00586 [Candidatus Nanoperiomorbus periodonticus]|nr:hypothetical protein G52EAM_00586 [Candidatus Nanoperiomorbus periodonticus]